jgi:hypothetical protein
MADKMPSPASYFVAIQNPQVNLADAVLKSARVKCDPLGMPVVRSGNFASTFQLEASSHSWAVRCFLRPSDDQQQRYAAISKFVGRHKRPYLVDVEHQARGILVEGKWHPIVKMPWVRDAVTLATYVDRHRRDPQKLVALRDAIAKIGRDLQSLNAAHGDLQMGNIMVKSSGEPVLVDYDGFYVPGMGEMKSAERGHPDFQHPYRDRQFDATLDRFSLFVLYLGLNAVTDDRWGRYGSGENMLFTSADFRDPDRSALFAELRANRSTRELAERLATIAKGSWAGIPTLDDFLTGGSRKPAVPVLPRPEPVRLYDVVDATDTDTLLQRFGEKVEVVGWVTAVGPERLTKHHLRPYVFVNFGNWWEGTFSLVLWSEALEAFSRAGRDILQYGKEWVSVVGVLSQYEVKPGIWSPRISINSPADIRILSGEKEAKERIHPPPPPPPPMALTREDRLTELYKDFPVFSESTAQSEIEKQPTEPTRRRVRRRARTAAQSENEKQPTERTTPASPVVTPASNDSDVVEEPKMSSSGQSDRGNPIVGVPNPDPQRAQPTSPESPSITNAKPASDISVAQNMKDSLPAASPIGDTTQFGSGSVAIGASPSLPKAAAAGPAAASNAGSGDLPDDWLQDEEAPNLFPLVLIICLLIMLAVAAVLFLSDLYPRELGAYYVERVIEMIDSVIGQE